MAPGSGGGRDGSEGKKVHGGLTILSDSGGGLSPSPVFLTLKRGSKRGVWENRTVILLGAADWKSGKWGLNLSKKKKKGENMGSRQPHLSKAEKRHKIIQQHPKK